MKAFINELGERGGTRWSRGACPKNVKKHSTESYRAVFKKGVRIPLKKIKGIFPPPSSKVDLCLCRVTAFIVKWIVGENQKLFKSLNAIVCFLSCNL